MFLFFSLYNQESHVFPLPSSRESIIGFVISLSFPSQQYLPVGVLINPLAKLQLPLSLWLFSCKSRNHPLWQKSPLEMTSFSITHDLFSHGKVDLRCLFVFVVFPLHLYWMLTLFSDLRCRVHRKECINTGIDLWLEPRLAVKTPAPTLLLYSHSDAVRGYSDFGASLFL